MGRGAALGELYDKGKGVAKDATRAAALYQQGCDGGEGIACYSVGWDFANGVGVTKDLTGSRALSASLRFRFSERLLQPRRHVLKGSRHNQGCRPRDHALSKGLRRRLFRRLLQPRPHVRERNGDNPGRQPRDRALSEKPATETISPRAPILAGCTTMATEWPRISAAP